MKYANDKITEQKKPPVIQIKFNHIKEWKAYKITKKLLKNILSKLRS